MASILTPAQITAFLVHIGLSPSQQQQRYTGDAAADLRFLRRLHIHTLSTVPYENLSLHYSVSHAISVDPQAAFAKIVTARRGRGGYCMENSLLYNHVLRGLGFPVYTSVVRIRLREGPTPVGDFVGWRHIVNLVTLADGRTWMVDVGFGGDGPTAPLPLDDESGGAGAGGEGGAAHRNLGTQQNRLVRDWIPAQTLRSPVSKLWIYQYRNAPDREWNSFYAFAEAEALETDFEVVNYYTATHPDSFQTLTPLVVKFLRRKKQRQRGDGEREEGEQREGEAEEEEDEEIYGKRMLVENVVKENLGGRTQVVQVCRTERERVEALQAWFGIELAEEERLAIRGWKSELKDVQNC